MATKAERERRDSRHLFSQLMDKAQTHVRVGQGRQDGTRVQLIGLARELHGLDGVCLCCPRRPAGELSSREQSLAAARRAAAASAEAGPRFAAGPIFGGDAELL